MHNLWFVQWDFTRRDHPGNLGRVSGSGPVTCSALCNYPSNICNTPKYTLAVFDMFRVFCKHNLNVS